MDWLWTLFPDATFWKDDTFWTAIGALATVGAIWAIVLRARQLQFDAWVKAQDIWMEDDFTDARGRVFQHLRNADAAWKQQDDFDARLVCRRMDEFARIAPYLALTKAGGVGSVLDVWADPIGKSWAILEPFVTDELDKYALVGKVGCVPNRGRKSDAQIASESTKAVARCAKAS